MFRNSNVSISNPNDASTIKSTRSAIFAKSCNGEMRFWRVTVVRIADVERAKD